MTDPTDKNYGFDRILAVMRLFTHLANMECNCQDVLNAMILRTVEIAYQLEVPKPHVLSAVSGAWECLDAQATAEGEKTLK